jgi:hypothetical protein
MSLPVHGNCKCASVVAQFGISADFDFDGVILSAAVFRRSEGSRAQRHRHVCSLRARSLARLNCAGHRDDAREKHTEIQIEPLPTPLNKCAGFDPFSFFPLESLILSAKLN